MPEPVTVQVVAGVVLAQNGKFLLVQEKQPKAYKKWNLPAGRVDLGETFEQAAVREAKEEVGYDVEIDRPLIVIHPSIDTSVLHAYAAHIVGGQLDFPEDEILDARWFTLGEIRNMKAELRRVEYVLGAVEAFGQKHVE